MYNKATRSHEIFRQHVQKLTPLPSLPMPSYLYLNLVLFIFRKYEIRFFIFDKNTPSKKFGSSIKREETWKKFFIFYNFGFQMVSQRIAEWIALLNIYCFLPSLCGNMQPWPPPPPPPPPYYIYILGHKFSVKENFPLVLLLPLWPFGFQMIRP